MREKGKSFFPNITPSIFLEKMKEKRDVNVIHHPNLTRAEINSRKLVIDWMCEIGSSLKVCPETIHKAVSYIDHIICENRIEENELRNIGLICILLSGKLFERDAIIEKIVALFRNYMGNPKLNIKQYEVQIMSNLHWDLQRITALDFIVFFSFQGILFTSDTIGALPVTEEAAKSLQQYSEFFADLCLEEYEFLSIDPLVLAVGIIMAARKVLNLENPWCKELEMLTTIRREEAEKYAEMVLNRYEKSFPNNRVKHKRILKSARNTYEMPKKRYM